jgi:hypothetical protein
MCDAGDGTEPMDDTISFDVLYNEKPKGAQGEGRGFYSDMDSIFEHAERVQSLAYEASPGRRTIPITLLTGFLGAGTRCECL